MKRRPCMNEASCAFVILTWNSVSYVERCLNSVLGLPFRELAVLVLDNGSDDGTVELIEEHYAKEIREGRLLLTRADHNLGTTVSRNILMRDICPETDYICVLDSDTEVYAEAFDVMCGHYADDAGGLIGVMGPRMRNESKILQPSGRSLPTLQIKLGKALPLHSLREWAAAAEVCDTPVRGGLQDVGYLLSACWLFPYSTYASVGPLDESIFYAPEDADWCARVHKAGLRVVIAHDAEILHAYQRIGHKKVLSRVNMSHIKGLVYFFLKHRYLFGSRGVWNPASAWKSRE